MGPSREMDSTTNRIIKKKKEKRTLYHVATSRSKINTVVMNMTFRRPICQRSINSAFMRCMPYDIQLHKKLDKKHMQFRGPFDVFYFLHSWFIYVSLYSKRYLAQLIERPSESDGSNYLRGDGFFVFFNYLCQQVPRDYYIKVRGMHYLVCLVLNISPNAQLI